MAGSPSERPVMARATEHSDERQRQREHDHKGVSERAETGDHDEVDQHDSDNHRDEDGLEALCDVGKDPAAGDADANRELKLRDLLLYQDSDALRVFPDDVAGYAGRPYAVGAAG